MPLQCSSCAVLPHLYLASCPGTILLIAHILCLESSSLKHLACRTTRGYVRYLGLSVHQPIHIQGCGDFNIDRIEVAEAPCSSGRKSAGHEVQTMDMAGSGARLLAVADPAARQGVVRLNTPDPLAGEQTWPTNEVSFLDKSSGLS